MLECMAFNENDIMKRLNALDVKTSINMITACCC